MSSSVTRTRFGLTRRTVLTNAQVLALPTTPIEVVPAQGLNLAIIPMLATMQLVWVADYTNIDAAAEVRFADPTLGNFVGLIAALETPDNQVSNILALGGNSVASFSGNAFVTTTAIQPLNPNTGNDPASINNVGLVIGLLNQLSGNLTGGDPGNSLIVTVFYNVVTLG